MKLLSEGTRRSCLSLPAGIFVLFAFLTVLLSSELIMAAEHKELKTVLQGNGEFTKNLYKVLAKKPGNIFFSPVSVHAILSLASQGSAGETKNAFAKALGIPDVKVGAEGYKEIMTRLNSVKDVTLLIANKVFLKESYKLQETFKTVAVQSFFSEVESIDFEKNVAAAKSINSWVETKTNNKIKDLISADDLTQDTRLVLVNAIYFKGKWAKPFPAEQTKTDKFYVNDNDTIDVQMMFIKDKFYYKNDENLDAKVLELPYANKDISLIIILPNQRNGIAALEEKLAQTDLTKITENMYRPEVEVSLPRFKIEQTLDLKDPLTQVGLGDIFSHAANFSGLIDSPEQLYVSKVVQKAFIEVNEEGAEAAAATGMDVRFRRCTTFPELAEFKADSPFIVTLVSKDSGLSRHLSHLNILFYGKVLKPSYTRHEHHDEL